MIWRPEQVRFVTDNEQLVLREYRREMDADVPRFVQPPSGGGLATTRFRITAYGTGVSGIANSSLKGKVINTNGTLGATEENIYVISYDPNDAGAEYPGRQDLSLCRPLLRVGRDVEAAYLSRWVIKAGGGDLVTGWWALFNVERAGC